jgi:hypothetical protein
MWVRWLLGEEQKSREIVTIPNPLPVLPVLSFRAEVPAFGIVRQPIPKASFPALGKPNL